MNPVSIVTIKNKIPLFKKDEPAESIELIELEEVGFELVAQKNLYNLGDKAVYIQPDYNLPDTPLFESYLRPYGQESKSMLGKVNGLPRRIRAKKFTLSKEPNGDPVYSNGILLPIKEVKDFLVDQGLWNTLTSNWDNVTDKLMITKYEEPENNSGGSLLTRGSSAFPEGIYKTDEENINNLWNHIEKYIGYPIHLVGTEKVDGSSITIGVTEDIPEGFICSRNTRKSLTITKVVGRRKKTWWETLMFWKNPDLNIYDEVDSDDDFVKFGKPYLTDLLSTGMTNVILRGELNGGRLKGSGNKNNPASKLEPNIKFYGSDNYSDRWRKDSYSFFSSLIFHLGFNQVETIFNREFNSKEELIDFCNSYFKENMIEGIVVRTLDSTFSAKIMNLEYDSKK